MRITKLHIKNFRGIENLEVTFDREITVLIGENNSGKTTILDALRYGLELVKSEKGVVFNEYDFRRHNNAEHISGCPIIELLYIFEESVEHPWSKQITQALNSVIVGQNNQVIKYRIKAYYDQEESEIKQEISFMDDAGQELSGKQTAIKDLKKIRPFFYLDTLRDASKEFQGNSSYWGSFIKDKSVDKDNRAILEEELKEIHKKILNSHLGFTDVIEEVKRISELVSVSGNNPVSVEPAPADIYRTLRSSQVTLTADGDAKIPLQAHGNGTQSLSVLLLFNAYLKSRLTKDIDKLAEPIIGIEEPEAHLHPNAIRAVWDILKQLPGQKIIATHSGDILSEVPVEKIKRMSKSGSRVVCHSLNSNTLEPEESRKFNHHVRRNRGELLFARCWILVEGETDTTVISECARILGSKANLNRHGIRIVEFSQASGPKLFIKAADLLGIAWHVVADNDQAGEGYLKQAKKLLDGRDEINHMSKLSASNMDVLLCISGFGVPYENRLPTQPPQPLPQATWGDVLSEMKKIYVNKPEQAFSVAKKLEDRSCSPIIVSSKGTPEYWEEVYRLLPRGASKPAAAMEALSLIEQRGEASVPSDIKSILQQAINLAGGQL